MSLQSLRMLCQLLHRVDKSSMRMVMSADRSCQGISRISKQMRVRTGAREDGTRTNQDHAINENVQ